MKTGEEFNRNAAHIDSKKGDSQSPRIDDRARTSPSSSSIDQVLRTSKTASQEKDTSRSREDSKPKSSQSRDQEARASRQRERENRSDGKKDTGKDPRPPRGSSEGQSTHRRSPIRSSSNSSRHHSDSSQKERTWENKSQSRDKKTKRKNKGSGSQSAFRDTSVESRTDDSRSSRQPLPTIPKLPDSQSQGSSREQSLSPLASLYFENPKYAGAMGPPTSSRVPRARTSTVNSSETEESSTDPGQWPLTPSELDLTMPSPESLKSASLAFSASYPLRFRRSFGVRP